MKKREGEVKEILDLAGSLLKSVDFKGLAPTTPGEEATGPLT